MDHSKINANIFIINGKIVVNSMVNENVPLIDKNDQLIIMKEIISDTLFNFEKEYQKQFIPTETTKYNLPDEFKNQ